MAQFVTVLGQIIRQINLSVVYSFPVSKHCFSLAHFHLFGRVAKAHRHVNGGARAEVEQRREGAEAGDDVGQMEQNHLHGRVVHTRVKVLIDGAIKVTKEGICHFQIGIGVEMLVEMAPVKKFAGHSSLSGSGPPLLSLCAATAFLPFRTVHWSCCWGGTKENKLNPLF